MLNILCDDGKVMSKSRPEYAIVPDRIYKGICFGCFGAIFSLWIFLC